MPYRLYNHKRRGSGETHPDLDIQTPMPDNRNGADRPEPRGVGSSIGTVVTHFLIRATDL